MEAKFSVIVPIYKVEKFLPCCIESVLSQTYQNFELILVDDGSPDACPAICDAYAEKDSRIRVVHKENGGLVSARIAGVQNAVGDYVCCLDGDDWLREDCLEKLNYVIEETQAEIVCFRIRWLADENDPRKPMNALPYRAGYYDRKAIETEVFSFLIENENGRYFPPSICGKVFKRDIYTQAQLMVPLRVKIGEDAACALPSVYRAESLYILDDDLYFYRQVNTSISKVKKPIDINEPKLRYLHMSRCIDLDKFDFRQQQYRSTVHALFNAAASQFYSKEDYFKIVKDIKRSIKDPVYAEAIRSCRFISMKGKLAAFVLRYRLFSLMWLYSRVK